MAGGGRRVDVAPRQGRGTPRPAPACRLAVLAGRQARKKARCRKGISRPQLGPLWPVVGRPVAALRPQTHPATKPSASTATAMRLRTVTASRITTEHHITSAGGASRNRKASNERGSTRSPAGQSSACASAPSPCQPRASSATTSQAMKTRPAKRPASRVRLPTGRTSSTSAMRSRVSLARMSNARKITATTKTTTMTTPCLPS